MTPIPTFAPVLFLAALGPSTWQNQKFPAAAYMTFMVDHERDPFCSPDLNIPTFTASLYYPISVKKERSDLLSCRTNDGETYGDISFSLGCRSSRSASVRVTASQGAMGNSDQQVLRPFHPAQVWRTELGGGGWRRPLGSWCMLARDI